MSNDTTQCSLCLAGKHESCLCPGVCDCCEDWIRAGPLRAFKFIADQTPVPDVGIYSRCATVALGQTVEEARAAIHAWARAKSAPEEQIDTRWVDYAPYVEMGLTPGAVLLFVML